MTNILRSRNYSTQLKNAAKFSHAKVEKTNQKKKRRPLKKVAAFVTGPVMGGRDGKPTRREIYSKSYLTNPKSDCIYYFPIDLKPNGHCPFAVPNQSENGKYNLILG